MQTDDRSPSTSSVSEKLARDHIQAIATAVAPITELWREALVIAGFPNIDDEAAYALRCLRMKILEMVDDAILAGVLEAETSMRRGGRRRG